MVLTKYETCFGQSDVAQIKYFFYEICESGKPKTVKQLHIRAHKVSTNEQSQILLRQ